MLESVLVCAFWVAIVFVCYTYLGYAILIWLLVKLKGKRASGLKMPETEYPALTHLVAAYNEADIIEDKIINSAQLDYPKGKLKTYFVTDGSTDETADIVSRHPEVQLFHSPERKGKINAVNRVMKLVDTPIVVFSDANTLLNNKALEKIARHYRDKSVGGVAGEKIILKKSADNAAGAGEGLYWKYESFLKRKDSELNSIVGAAGELFSVRTELFIEPPSSIIIEDFYISLLIASKGFRFVYEPEATATETASASVQEEWKRKVRICAGGFQAMGKLLFLLNPFRYGTLSFQYISHRVLRWTLAPLSLLIILATSISLSLMKIKFFQIILSLQILFYGLAFVGRLMQSKEIRIKGFFVPYYFTVMNLSVYAGFFRFIKGKQSVLWEKAKRA